LRNNPNVDGVYRYPAPITILQFLQLIRRVRRQRYSLGLSLDRSPLANAMLLMARIPERAGIDSAGRGVGLTRRARPRSNQHETELYLEVAKGVGATACGVYPEYCPTSDARATAATLLGGLTAPIVVIHPGGAVNPESTLLSKRWPAERFGELASDLVQRHDASIVVVGSESDRSATQATIDFTDAHVTDLAEQLSVSELAAVCERSQLYVGNDSGMSHLAAAVGTPTVTIFGPTSPAIYRPLGLNADVCAPTVQGRTAISARDLRGENAVSGPDSVIDQISVEIVLEACERLLERTGKAGQL
jgi:heptosyltransferase-2/heptosyltransferase-3